MILMVCLLEFSEIAVIFPVSSSARERDMDTLVFGERFATMFSHSLPILVRDATES